MYSEIEVKVSDPCVTLCETIIDTSNIKCYAETPNKKNKITMVAGPLDKGLADDIYTEQIDLSSDKKVISQYF
jgi:U5 small nuclear ribonucleoprotein component